MPATKFTNGLVKATCHLKVSGDIEKSRKTATIKAEYLPKPRARYSRYFP